MIGIHCFASSSEGNCYLLTINNNSPRPIRILVECGLSYKNIVEQLFKVGVAINDIQAVLVTHGHTDHSKGLKDLSARGKRCFGSKETITVDGVQNARELRAGETALLDEDVYVIPFKVEHDYPGSLGFIIKTNDDLLLFVNDCKYFESDLSAYKFTYVMIECDYDAQVAHIAYTNAKKNKDYQEETKYRRLLDSHMSNRNCLRTLKTFDLSKCIAIFLMHLSDGNSNEKKFKHEFQNELKKPVLICGKHGGIT